MELTIEEALQQGISAHKAGKLEEAERLYRAIIGSVPTHSDANHNLGVLAVGVGKVDTALPYFKTALEASPNHGQYWISYIDALIKLGRIDDASKVLEQGKAAGLSGDAVTELESRLSGSVKVEQSEIDNLVNLYSAGKLSEALSMGTALINRQPDNYIVHNILGAINTALDNNKRALAHYDKAIQINPNFAGLHLNKGVSLRKMNHYEWALASYNKALELDPNLVEAHSNMGHTLNILGRREEALASLVKAIKIKPSSSGSYNNLGDVLYNLDRFEDASLNFKKALILNPNLSEADNNLGNVCYQFGDTDGALLQYTKAVMIDPRSGEAWGNQGVAFSNCGEVDKAIESYKKAIENGYGPPSNLVDLCLLFQQKGEYDLAVEAVSIDLTKNRKIRLY